jgi:general secretion pathway protein D
VTVNSSVNPTTNLGVNFNNPALPLGANPLVNPSQVGFQGISSLGVGRTNSSGLGGFVFSAASNSVNILIRALKTQGRIDILSCPQIMAVDNQTANLNVGQAVPYVSASSVTGTGIVNNTITYRDVGVLLTVTPRISPDGTVIMRVTPEVSSVASTTIPLGNGNTATAFNVQHFDTTVFARDGETVAIGGLLTKNNNKQENKLPWFGDLPYLGALFRYRTQTKSKTELLVIMTPHIVRTEEERARVLTEEAQRMDWCVEDVVRMHGGQGLLTLLPPPPTGRSLGTSTPPCFLHEMPGPAALLPSIVPAPEPQPEKLPQPRPTAPAIRSPMSQGQALPDAPPIQAAQVAPVAAKLPADGSTQPAEPAKENGIWYRFFHRN